MPGAGSAMSRSVSYRSMDSREWVKRARRIDQGDQPESKGNRISMKWGKEITPMFRQRRLTLMIRLGSDMVTAV